MVTADGYAKIVDFGLAKLVEPRAALTSDSGVSTLHKTGERVVLGTIGYMSPEQVEARPADHRSDIFSFGCSLYEAVTRRRAFASIDEIVDGDPPPLPAGVPPDLRRIIARCLAKRADERYQSIRDVVADLREAMQSRAGASVRWGRPVALALTGAVIITTAAVLMRDEPPTSIQPRRITSLAVLPLENFSPKEAEEYFVDGITDGITTELAKTGVVKVIPRRWAMKYKGSTKSPKEIAHELGVDGVIEGSVHREGERLRIHARFIDATTDQHLWAYTYEGERRQIIGLQQDLAAAVVQAISGRPTAKEMTHPGPRTAVNPDAHDLYLQGLYISEISPFGRARESIGLFERAIELDSTFALAHAALARSYLLLGGMPGAATTEACVKARVSAARALELDENLAEGHAVLAFVKWACDRDWPDAGRHFRRAVALNPTNASTLSDYAHYLDLMGRNDEAIAAAKQAIELEPRHEHRWALGALYYFGRRYDEAVAEFDKNLRAVPTDAHQQRLVAVAHVARGAHAVAIAAAEKAYQMAVDNGAKEGVLRGYEATVGVALAAAGQRARARQILQRVNETVDPPRGLFRVQLHVALGDNDVALELIEEQLREGSWSSVQAYWRDPLLDPLRSDPRYHAVMRRFGLPIDGVAE